VTLRHRRPETPWRRDDGCRAGDRSTSDIHRSGDESVDEGSGECAGEERRRLEGEQGKSAVVQRFGDGRIADERHQSGSKTVRDGRSDTEEKVRQHRGEDEPVVVTVPATVENSHSGGVPAARTERDVGGADREVTIRYGE